MYFKPWRAGLDSFSWSMGKMQEASGIQMNLVDQKYECLECDCCIFLDSECML